MLYHTYSKFSGFLVNVLGLAVIVAGGFLLGADKIQVYQALLYVFAGIGFIGYTHLQLKLRASKLMKQDKYQQLINYEFDDNGIVEHMSDRKNEYKWGDIIKAVATPKDIAFYIDEGEALVVPKESFGENFMPVMKLIAQNMNRSQIYIS